jgi:hypothetical protein
MSLEEPASERNLVAGNDRAIAEAMMLTARDQPPASE